MNIRELREKSLKIAHEARSLLDTITHENTAEKEAEFDRMIAESDSLAARADKLAKIEARERDFATIETRSVDETVTVETRSEPTADERRDGIFNNYLRGFASSNELRAAAVGTDSDGGYLVPTTMASYLVKAMKAYGPMNEGGPATVIVSGSGNPYTIPTNDDTSGLGSLIGENTEAADSDLTFGQLTMNAYKFTSGVFKVSSELLTDSALDVQQIVSDAMAERMGRVVNKYLTTGTGSAQPQGIVTGASAGLTSASATGITWDEIEDLISSLDPAYRDRGAFMFHDSTRGAIRKLKDSQNRPLWQPSYQVGDPDTLMSYRFYVNQDMDSIGAGKKTVLFGDFSKFQIRRVRNFAVQRLNERYAEFDQVGFVGFLRLDGKVVDSRAIKVLTQAAS